MSSRKKKILFIQTILLIIGLMILFFTYKNKQLDANKIFLSTNIEKKNNEDLKKNKKKPGANAFYNIEYSGLDLSGNRFVLKSKEAVTFDKKPELVNMKYVDAVFYFGDGSNLKVKSNSGIYNTRSFDIKFFEDVTATHLSSKLQADQAEYLSSMSKLTISKNVIINSPTGNLIADELLFDVKNQVLEIHSFNENKINANIKNNEKRF